MGNPYPANVLRPDGTVSQEGFVDFTDSENQPGGGGTGGLIASLAFTYATADLNEGVAIFTPAVGTVITDIWVAIATAFDGTTPTADVGTFNGGDTGVFDEVGVAAVSLANADAAVDNNAGLTNPPSATTLSASVIASASGDIAGLLAWYLTVTEDNPLLLVVSQDGTLGGDAIGGSAGAGTVYIFGAVPS